MCLEEERGIVALQMSNAAKDEMLERIFDLLFLDYMNENGRTRLVWIRDKCCDADIIGEIAELVCEFAAERIRNPKQLKQFLNGKPITMMSGKALGFSRGMKANKMSTI